MTVAQALALFRRCIRSPKPRVKIELDVFRPDSERAVILEMGNE